VKKLLFVSTCLIILVLSSGFSSLESAEKILVFREAFEEHTGTVSVEAHLIGDILEVKATARIVRAKPKIENIILVGPKIGRMVPVTVKKVYATSEEEAPYITRKRGGLITFDDKKKTKKPKGSVDRKLATFKINKDKIIKGKRYEVWVRVKKEGAGRRGKLTSYKFNLEKLPELVHNK